MANERVCKITGCDKPHRARGWCATHYMRWKQNGDPNKLHLPERGAQMDWIAANVGHGGTECLVWPFHIAPNGYGRVRVDGRNLVASRVMCETAHGPAPSPSHEAAHSCGNRACLNPNHIRWATVAENHADKIGHGTHLFGASHGMAKLNENEVLEIRKMWADGILNQHEIAREFGVSNSAICDVVRGKTWAHLV